MAIVKFSCGKCGKAVAVDSAHLGKPVRCPHCQQIIQAPAAETPASVPAPAAEAAFSAPPAVPQESSIFDPADETGGDALFASPYIHPNR